MLLRRTHGWALVAPAVALLIAAFLVPLAIFVVYSLRPSSTAELAGEGFSLDNYRVLLKDDFFVATLRNTLLIAAAATFFSVLLAMPIAAFIQKSPPWLKGLLLSVSVFPLLLGAVVRSIGWVGLLGFSGVVNALLVRSGLREEPLELLQTASSVVLVMVTIVLPVMILVIYAAMESVDPYTDRAALSLGSTPLRAFFRVALPQIVPAITTGASLVFVLCVNAYSTPVLIGGSRVPMMAPQIYSTVSTHADLPTGAAMSVTAVIASVVIVVVFSSVMRWRYEGWRRVSSSW